MRGTKLCAIVAAAFIAGVFLASPELRATAAPTITSADILDETIQSIDIKDGEVKASDIAADAVGSSEIASDSVTASEIAGVTKLLFSSCLVSNSDTKTPGSGMLVGPCGLKGADDLDHVVVQIKGGNTCFAITDAHTSADHVVMFVRNVCSSPETLGAAEFSIILFDK